jgi:hypothetical protein
MSQFLALVEEEAEKALGLGLGERLPQPVLGLLVPFAGGMRQRQEKLYLQRSVLMPSLLGDGQQIFKLAQRLTGLSLCEQETHPEDPGCQVQRERKHQRVLCLCLQAMLHGMEIACRQ